LAEAVVLQGFSVRDVFDKVGLEIAKKGDGQKPWTSTSYGASAGWYLNGRLTKEQQDRIERDAVRIARESREATDRGDAAVGALLAL
ncbi:hypothetical protein ABI004_14900, partial [Enterococcus faecium]|uniref:hypothetical protein n=1 Tax=Enterococcus faecium TaxID=1352 RepID=UPI003F41C367